MDVVFAAQAFHWFNPSKARAEFRRILKKPRPVALLWNDRQIPSGSGAEELDWIMKSLRAQSPQTLEADEIMICEFFGSESLNRAEFKNSTWLSREALCSMVLSRSYAPLKDEAGYDRLVERLEELFEKYAVDGQFAVPYKTQVYWGWI